MRRDTAIRDAHQIGADVVKTAEKPAKRTLIVAAAGHHHLLLWVAVGPVAGFIYAAVVALAGTILTVRTPAHNASHTQPLEGWGGHVSRHFENLRSSLDVIHDR